jgi:circadian clock protein KaiB
MSGAAAGDGWVLTLYVSGASPRSIEAVEAVRRVCDEELGRRADLEVIDVQQQPELGAADQIIVVPTLVKRLPGPLRRIVGDLWDPARLRRGLDLGPAEVGCPNPDA